MNIVDIILILLIAAALTGAVIKIVTDRKKGKSCGCGDCSRCSACDKTNRKVR
ncbi:MAG: FeoB-associated Cys-rich membrane protein [Ruminiclostridium sp.]|nr:FeoB-associated Cys-rich membrane protein [Ruminiclostridium sp.]